MKIASCLIAYGESYPMIYINSLSVLFGFSIALNSLKINIVCKPSIIKVDELDRLKLFTFIFGFSIVLNNLKVNIVCKLHVIEVNELD